MLTDMLAVLHCVLSALATATPLCCYQQRRLALCAFIIGCDAACIYCYCLHYAIIRVDPPVIRRFFKPRVGDDTAKTIHACASRLNEFQLRKFLICFVSGRIIVLLAQIQPKSMFRWFVHRWVHFYIVFDRVPKAEPYLCLSVIFICATRYKFIMN